MNEAPRKKEIWAAHDPAIGGTWFSHIGSWPEERTRYVLASTADACKAQRDALLEALKPLLGADATEAIFGLEHCLPNPEWLAKARAAIALCDEGGDDD